MQEYVTKEQFDEFSKKVLGLLKDGEEGGEPAPETPSPEPDTKPEPTAEKQDEEPQKKPEDEEENKQDEEEDKKPEDEENKQDDVEARLAKLEQDIASIKEAITPQQQVSMADYKKQSSPSPATNKPADVKIPKPATGEGATDPKPPEKDEVSTNLSKTVQDLMKEVREIKKSVSKVTKGSTPLPNDYSSRTDGKVEDMALAIAKGDKKVTMGDLIDMQRQEQRNRFKQIFGE